LAEEVVMGNVADLPDFALCAESGTANIATVRTAQNVEVKARRMRNLRDPWFGEELTTGG
jgi:hypothetical protein